MSNVLLDYFFPISSITPTPEASTAFLKQVCIVCLPNGGGTAGDITVCTSQAEIAAVTDNLEAQQALNGGMSKVYVLQAADLDLADFLVDQDTVFYTLLISSDFDDTAIASLDKGTFGGVVGLSTDDDTNVAAYAAVEKQVGFKVAAANGAKNMIYAFGKLLSNALNWSNQQYITMPLSDDITALGDAVGYFDDKVSFVLEDDSFGKRLGLFAVGAKAIVAPYIERNLEIDMQSKALTYVSGNQPQYTKTQAALLQDELQKVIDLYIERQWIELGTVSVELEQSNFVASGYINISEPKALWRILGEIRQTL